MPPQDDKPLRPIVDMDDTQKRVIEVLTIAFRALVDIEIPVAGGYSSISTPRTVPKLVEQRLSVVHQTQMNVALPLTILREDLPENLVEAYEILRKEYNIDQISARLGS